MTILEPHPLHALVTPAQLMTEVRTGQALSSSRYSPRPTAQLQLLTRMTFLL